jgi:hypothetical protein
MLWMIVERFRGGDAVPVYRRFRDRGRMAPDRLRYVASWVSEDFTVCYQLMEADERAPLDAWMENWRDLADFEVVAVMPSAQAVEKIRPRL